MALLRELTTVVPLTEHFGSLDLSVNGVQFDSRKVEAGDVFVAVPGTQVDGHRFIPTALERGAAAVVCERLPDDRRPETTYLRVPSASHALGLLAHALRGHPSRRLSLVGVTGTNGKTTTATLLYRLYTALGYSCGLLSTIRNYVKGEVIPSTHTTGDSLQIAELMARMVEEGCTHCFMEVTSHAIDQNRISGLEFDGAVFTNLTQDHLDYHHTMEVYRDVKKSFFDNLPSEAFALANADDDSGLYMIRDTHARRATYGRGPDSDFRLEVVSSDFAGLRIRINGTPVASKLVGLFNAYNAAAVIGAATLLKERFDRVVAEVEKLEPVEGRMERIAGPDEITVVVDFAHTPDALEKVLANLASMNPAGVPIITIVGCGGDRDREKRPIMGEIAAKHSNQVIFTSDNPRSESADGIIEEMMVGVPPALRNRVSVVADRKKAIESTCAGAPSASLILIAGKGHEKYQEIRGERRPFDDVALARASLKRRAAGDA